MDEFILQYGAFIMAAAGIPALLGNMAMRPEPAREDEEIGRRYRHLVLAMFVPQIAFFLLWGFCQIAGNHKDFVFLISSTEHLRPSVMIPRIVWFLYAGTMLYWVVARGGAELIATFQINHPLLSTPGRVKLFSVLLVSGLVVFLVAANLSGRFVMT